MSLTCRDAMTDSFALADALDVIKWPVHSLFGHWIVVALLSAGSSNLIFAIKLLGQYIAGLQEDGEPPGGKLAFFPPDPVRYTQKGATRFARSLTFRSRAFFCAC